MYRLLLLSAVLLPLVCAQGDTVDETEIHKMHEKAMGDMRTLMGEMETKMTEHAGDNMDALKEFMTENIVERLENIEGVVKSIQEKQSYFEHCLNAFPCGEHGKCSVVDNNYKCTCEEGYEGEHCEVFDVCRNVECQNGGTCHAVEYDDGNVTSDHVHTDDHMVMHESEYMCVCDGTWYGDHCELQAPCAAALEAIDPDASGPVGKEKPRCEEDGFYHPIQYRGTSAYCVTSEGEDIPGYRMRRQEVTEESSCSCARDEFTAKSDGHLGEFYCARNGNYLPYTCVDRKCYCQDTEGNVNESSGVPRRMMRRRLRCPGMDTMRPGRGPAPGGGPRRGGPGGPGY